MGRVRQAIDEATRTLVAAGVASPRVDAEELAAHVAGTTRGRLSLLEVVGDDFFGRYADLVAARSSRIPLQHITGTAAFASVNLNVGPGVFIPRPETEALFEWAAAQDLPAAPLIVDLCTGSGALAVALARHTPAARVIGVDISTEALAYARRNSADTSVELREGDVTDPSLGPDLDGRVDLVVANPPYLPDAVVLEPEVAEHDPHQALFGGPDGTAFVAAIASLAGRWLADGGRLAIEHDDTASAATRALLGDTAHFDDIEGHTDLTGRLRFVTARRVKRP
ncbi:MAG: release factor glutamine methyltransferase [Mycobacterium sp.]|nr:release factor glutamine methyltransferase [Mycobacterium sp.]